MRVLLTGFMASGKTTTGRRLAGRLEVPFFDLDALVVEASGRSIPALFAEEGEATFRQLEAAVLRETEWPEACVIATGGGCLVDPENMAWAKRSGQVVWLDPPFETLQARLGEPSGAERPLSVDIEAVAALYRQRRAAYQLADLHLPVASGESVADVSRRIAEALAEFACAT